MSLQFTANLIFVMFLGKWHIWIEDITWFHLMFHDFEVVLQKGGLLTSV